NVHRGLHTLSNEATEAYERAREIVARFLNAPSADNIVWTKGGTEAINLVANGVGLSILPGDEIIVTEMEHHSNIVPWHFLRERRGAVLKWAPIKDDGSLDMEAFAALLGPKTKLVAVTHMSNVLGTINPVAEITRLAHAVGARVLVDGCQGAVHAAPDVQAIGCDYYVLTGHKLFAPTGIGVLYGSTEALDALPPYQGGGEMIVTVEKEGVTYAKPPHRFEAGTPPILEAIGMGAAVEWLSQYDPAAIQAHEMALYHHAVERLRGHNWLRILGETEGKGAILTFTVEGAHAHDVAQIMDRYGVAVRAGLHCAEPLAKRLGVSASARASFALYNTIDLIEALKTVYDPEIPVDIYELGLIYKVDVSDDRDVLVEMTLTAPGCPVAGEMPGWVETAVSKVDGVRSAKANLVFDPPWDSSKMSDEAKLALNMF
ncbi:MAG: SUF system Fe-S cluster assembly protein, partial [Brevundimonas diminuta]|nr:SUF system Fe-S cluster assembly protein [Brevundimonas diminuta]